MSVPHERPRPGSPTEQPTGPPPRAGHLDNQATVVPQIANHGAAGCANDETATQIVGTSDSDGKVSAEASDQQVRHFGDYLLLKEIARGGMGKVLVARDLTLNREVALKILLPGANADRFIRESKITARLSHPSIPPVHAMGILADGSQFLAMKLIAGRTLADELQTADRPRLLQAFSQVCQAVGFAHSQGVIHRDLKPANIMVGAFGEVQVMDWGLAKELTNREVAENPHSTAAPDSVVKTDNLRTAICAPFGESTDGRTQAGQVMGTPAYMAPEQARGQATDARTDVFALGGILCAILTRQPPFVGKSSFELIQRAAAGNLDDAFSRLVSCGADAELIALCRRCLSPSPADRPPNGQVVADELTAYQNSVQERLHQVELAQAEEKTKAVEQRKRRRIIAVLTVVGAILAVVGLLIALEMQNAARATGLVNSLCSADIAEVPPILHELEGHRHRATPVLVSLAARTPSSQDERRAQLHARLALVASDESQVRPLVEFLLAGHVLYVGIVRDQLAPYHQQFLGDLWTLLHDATAVRERRFHAGLALATYATTSPQWTTDDFTFLADQLVAANPEHQARIREYLRPVANRLLSDLGRIFAGPKVAESRRMSAANAFADYVRNDVPKLSELLTIATPDQYAVLYPIVAASSAPSTIEDLARFVAMPPLPDLGPAERVFYGQRRANATVTLLRLGEREKILPVFELTDDPEALTQFIFRCRPRGVGVESLLDCVLRISDAPQDRYPRHARYALLLALGEFALDEIPNPRREALVKQLTESRG